MCIHSLAQARARAFLAPLDTSPPLRLPAFAPPVQLACSTLTRRALLAAIVWRATFSHLSPVPLVQSVLRAIRRPLRLRPRANCALLGTSKPPLQQLSAMHARPAVNSPTLVRLNCASLGVVHCCSGGSSCDQCIAGTHSASSASSECLPCGAGSVSPSGSSVCSLCTGGSYSAVSGASACVACDVGSASNASGLATVCPMCVAGYYQSGVGKTTCLPCSPGSAQSNDGVYEQPSFDVLTCVVDQARHPARLA